MSCYQVGMVPGIVANEVPSLPSICKDPLVWRVTVPIRGIA